MKIVWFLTILNYLCFTKIKWLSLFFMNFIKILIVFIFGLHLFIETDFLVFWVLQELAVFEIVDFSWLKRCSKVIIKFEHFYTIIERIECNMSHFRHLFTICTITYYPRLYLVFKGTWKVEPRWPFFTF